MSTAKIIILAGQSNAQGSGRGPVEKEWEEKEYILSMKAAHEVRWTEDATFVTFKEEPFSIRLSAEEEENGIFYGDFSLTFALEYAKKYLQKNRKVLIIRSAVGGTAFSDGCWGVGAQLYNKSLEMTNYALDLNENNRVVAFLWHQGESDFCHKNPIEKFEMQLKEMLLDMRGHYGEIPVIAGDFVQDWKEKNPQTEEYTQAIKRAIKEVGNASFVESNNLLSNAQKLGDNDDIHFCRQALVELGERYFKAFEDLNK